MAKARQQYFSDEVAINKEARTFVFDDELLDKINDIDGRAEENVIEIVKVNGTPLVPDAQKAVDVPVPGVIDSLSSTSTTNSLSAYQGKILYDYIMNLQSRGRFLSNWDAANGIPVTTPFGNSYNYNPGDYYVVGVVDSTTNYRPDGATYVTGAVSTVVETETLDVSDMYVYDGTQWTLLKNTARQIAIDQTLSTTSTNPVENRVITNALNTKQNLLTAGTNITIDGNNEISAVDTTYSNLPAAEGGTADSLVTTGEKYEWSQKQGALTAGANIQINGNVISATDTIYGNLPGVEGGLDDTLVTTGDKYNWDNKLDSLTAGANITIVGDVISAVDTTYSNLPAAQGGVDVTLVTTGDKYNWNNKPDALVAGDNIQINNGVISATNTTYTAGGGIDITTDIITNTRPFDPGVGFAGQVLKKTPDGYAWANETATSGVTSVNGRAGDVTVSEFLPGEGSSGQVLKKTSSGYAWANESGGGGGGGGGGNIYYGGDGIRITSNNEIINTKPFEPGSGTTGQVLTKTSNGYEWDAPSLPSGKNYVKFWTIRSDSMDTPTMKEIMDWVALDPNNGAILNDRTTNDTFVFNKYLTNAGYAGAVFYGTKRTTNVHTSGNYTRGFAQTLTLTSHNGSSYNCTVAENIDDDTHTNYISAMGANYTNTFIPTESYQPATKGYVDSQVAAANGGITNNISGTTHRILQEWVGTQAQYDALVSNNNVQSDVIYNIIPS